MFLVEVNPVDAWNDLNVFPSGCNQYWCNSTDLTVNAKCAHMLTEYMRLNFSSKEYRAAYYYSKGLVGLGAKQLKIGRRLPRTQIYRVRDPNANEQLSVPRGELFSGVPENAEACTWRID